MIGEVVRKAWKLQETGREVWRTKIDMGAKNTKVGPTPDGHRETTMGEVRYLVSYQAIWPLLANYLKLVGSYVWMYILN